VGIQFGLTIGLFAWAGVWLDGKFGWSPILTIVLTFVAFGGSMASLIYRVRDMESRDKKK